MMMRQAQQDEENQRRQKLMFEWEDRKQVQETLEKEQQLKKKAKERCEKIAKKEKAYQTFKEWLKMSLIKQSYEIKQKMYFD